MRLPCTADRLNVFLLRKCLRVNPALRSCAEDKWICRIKSDDVMGRVKAYELIVKGESIQEPGIPESFKILVNELRSLCLRVTVEDKGNKELSLKDLDELTGNDDVRLARSVGFFN